MPNHEINSSSIPDDVLSVLSQLEQAGYAAYCVGGCVRDILRGAEVNDYDIASAATPDQLRQLFTEYTLIDTGLAFGTLTLLTQTKTEQRAIEITTFRADGNYSDGRRPDSVSFSTNIEDDLARRDFTINAMAYSPKRGLVDLFGGQQDLTTKTLRAVGDAETRIREDALRIMRALRFAATLELNIEESLAHALIRNKMLLQNVSAERIQAELMRLLAAPAASLLQVLLGFGEVLAVPIPELAPMIGHGQFSPWHDYDLWEHTARALVATSSDDPLLRLALLLHDIGKPPTFTRDDEGEGHFYRHAPEGAKLAEPRLRALKFDNKTTELTTELVRYHYADVTPETITKWLQRLGEAQLRRVLAVKLADLTAHSAQAIEQSMPTVVQSIEALDRAIAGGAVFTLKAMAISGDDLIALGVKPGPPLGQMLESLLDAIVEGTLPNEREALLTEARRLVAASKELPV